MEKKISHSSTVAQIREQIKDAAVPSQDLETELLIIGGNLTALTLASILQERGHDVLLMLDIEKFLEQVKEEHLFSTTSPFPLYSELIRTAGVEQTKLYYEAIQEAVYFFKYQMERLKIDCSLTVQDVYFFAETIEDEKTLENEIFAMEQIGIPIERMSEEESERISGVRKTDFILRDQLQFCPSRYSASILSHFCSHGGKIVTKETIIKLDKSDPNVLHYGNYHRIQTQKIIFTIPTSLLDHKPLFLSSYQDHYSIKTGILRKHPGDGIHVWLNSARSLHSQPSDASFHIGVLIERILDHTSLRDDKKSTSTRIEQEYFKSLHVTQKVSEHLSTLDRLPSIGRLNPNLFIATGYHEDDISNSVLSALLLTSLIRDLPSNYRSLSLCINRIESDVLSVLLPILTFFS